MIDWAQVKQLEEDVGSEDLADVVTLFLSEVDEAVEALQSLPKDSAPEVAAALHFLKGSAFNLGFQEFGDYCAAGETQAHGGDTESVSFQAVERLYLDSKSLFLDELSSHCSVQL